MVIEIEKPIEQVVRDILAFQDYNGEEGRFCVFGFSFPKRSMTPEKVEVTLRTLGTCGQNSYVIEYHTVGIKGEEGLGRRVITLGSVSRDLINPRKVTELTWRTDWKGDPEIGRVYSRLEKVIKKKSV